MLRNALTSLSLSLLSCAALTLDAAAQAPAPVSFHLDAGSSYQTGCLPPCLCPILFQEALGSLVMTRVEPSPLFADVYTISDVAFFVGSPGQPGTGIFVSGSGTYFNSVQLGPQHRMELDLSFNGAPPVHFETDWVTNTEPFPEIDIAVARNGFVCNDQVFYLSLRPDLFTSFCTALPNSTGAPALISASGTASVSSNDLVLHAAPVPAGQPGLFYFGPQMTQAPFGDGFRCVTGFGVTRFAPTAASAVGELSFPVDNTALPNGMSFFPGATWLFQAWYRDPAAAASGFNLSDGAAVLFGV